MRCQIITTIIVTFAWFGTTWHHRMHVSDSGIGCSTTSLRWTVIGGRGIGCSTTSLRWTVIDGHQAILIVVPTGTRSRKTPSSYGTCHMQNLATTYHYSVVPAQLKLAPIVRSPAALTRTGLIGVYVVMFIQGIGFTDLCVFIYYFIKTYLCRITQSAELFYNVVLYVGWGWVLGWGWGWLVG